ncbi:MAG: hypothetical protein HDKAJFGB_02363 [Anaerolineae bacterium]|nr:hypothetical protein [Anaerolineae bacterium]
MRPRVPRKRTPLRNQPRMSIPTKTLRRFAFFASAPNNAMKRLAAQVTRLEFEPNTLVFCQGDPGDYFYMIQDGTIEILNASAETQLNLLHAGQWFGDFALLDDAPRSALARTRTRAILLALPRAEFLELVTTYPLVLYVLATSSQQQLRERDRAYLAAVETRARQLEQLYFTALDITRHLDRTRALEAIRARAIELLHSAGGDLYLFDASVNGLVAQTAAAFDASRFQQGKECADSAFATGAPRIVTPTRRAPRHELAAPIQLTEPNGTTRPLGALRVYRAKNGIAYNDEDCKLLELFASQAAIVIENADLIQTRVLQSQLENELQNARRVQRQLIPFEPPRLRGYQIATLWYPAKQVSGDYYDFIPLADGRVAFVIADVSGKGLDAAMFMANTRATLRASAVAGDDPAAIVARANQTLAQDSLGGMFVTMFFGILDPLNGAFAYVNAGHNPPLLWRADTRTLETLEIGDRALAITNDFVYRPHRLTLNLRDLLLLYTDGVNEATNAADAQFGMERLENMIRQNASASARQIIRRLDQRVRAFTGAFPQSDDITVVALRRA